MTDWTVIIIMRAFLQENIEHASVPEPTRLEIQAAEIIGFGCKDAVDQR